MYGVVSLSKIYLQTLCVGTHIYICPCPPCPPPPDLTSSLEMVFAVFFVCTLKLPMRYDTLNLTCRSLVKCVSLFCRNVSLPVLASVPLVLDLKCGYGIKLAPRLMLRRFFKRSFCKEK